MLGLHSRPVAHGAHVAPPAPHELFDSLASGSHVPALQQPAHADPPHEHAPFEHDWPLLHALQTAPAVPHSLDDCAPYGTHVPPLQQPFGHDVESQMHSPVVALQRWPVPHAAHVAPPAPHEPDDSDAYASHVPAVPPLQQPPGHVTPSHEQVPVPVSQRPFAQTAHAAPAAPHSLAD